MKIKVPIALLVGTLLVYSSAFAGNPNQKSAQPTTLRVSGSPTGVFKTYPDGTYITSAQADVRNVGTVTAESVSVNVILPNGRSVSLNGPIELGPNKSATYTASLFEAVTSTKALSAKATCSNCRR